jgi:hypothetical protein
MALRTILGQTKAGAGRRSPPLTDLSFDYRDRMAELARSAGGTYPQPDDVMEDTAGCEEAVPA